MIRRPPSSTLFPYPTPFRSRVAEWVLACARRDRSLLRSAMDDRMHQPGRARAYPYLDDTIAAAEQAGALCAALSGAGGAERERTRLKLRPSPKPDCSLCFYK